jgi:SAM-dependent methyltransferase
MARGRDAPAPGRHDRAVVHDAARGFESEDAAGAYERGRPEYPRAALDLVVRALGIVPGTPVLDLGAGTGKFARALAGRGARVVALEPAAAMIRAVAGAEGVVPVRGVAEALPVRDAAVGAVTAASAFHWFDGPRALREMHRALRPGGRVALVWNRRDDGVPWVARLSAVVNRREGGAPRYRTGAWRTAFEVEPGLFSPVGEAHFRHAHALPPEGVVDRVASISFIARLPAGERATILGQVRALLASHPDTVGREELELVYTTDVHVYEARRR